MCLLQKYKFMRDYAIMKAQHRRGRLITPPRSSYNTTALVLQRHRTRLTPKPRKSSGITSVVLSITFLMLTNFLIVAIEIGN